MTLNKIKLIHVILCVTASIIAIIIGAILAEWFKLPFFHVWALAHGTFVILFPVYCVVFFYILRPFIRKIDNKNTSPIIYYSGKLSIIAILSVVISSVSLMIPMYVISTTGILLGAIARYRCHKKPDINGKGVAIFGMLIGLIGLINNIYMDYMIKSAIKTIGS